MSAMWKPRGSRRPWSALALGWMTGLVVVAMGPPNAAAQCQIEMAKVLASDGAPDDFFGISVAVAGDTLVVGAPGQAGRQGAAYVFYRDQGGVNRWGEVAKLVASDAAPGDWFGSDVAIWNDTVVVGARTAEAQAGAVYVFERDLGGADSWGEAKKLTASDGLPGDALGETVAIWGDTIVSGAPEETGPPAWNVGAAYVFERDLGGPGNWGQAAKLIQSDGIIGIGHFAGPGLAIEGDTIVGGAYGAYNGPLESGAVYVYERDFGGPGNWGEVVKLAPADIAEYDFFGSGLALSGNTLAVSSHGGGGAVYVFERNGTWSEQTKLSKSFSFGNNNAPVALDGDVLLVSGGHGTAAAYTFGRNVGGPGHWGDTDRYLQSDGSPVDWFGFGFSLAVAGDTHVVGARTDDDLGADSGSVYVFDSSPLLCPESYCTSGTTASGCQATIATRGVQSASLSSGFELVARDVEGHRNGLFFFGITGRQALPWGLAGNGCSSYLCVAGPRFRGGLLAGTGAPGACDGTFTYDLNAHWSAHPSQSPGLGTTVQAQLWFRDPNNPCTGTKRVATTSLSDAIEFVVGP